MLSNKTQFFFIVVPPQKILGHCKDDVLHTCILEIFQMQSEWVLPFPIYEADECDSIIKLLSTPRLLVVHVFSVEHIVGMEHLS